MRRLLPLLLLPLLSGPAAAQNPSVPLGMAPAQGACFPSDNMLRCTYTIPARGGATSLDVLMQVAGGAQGVLWLNNCAGGPPTTFAGSIATAVLDLRGQQRPAHYCFTAILANCGGPPCAGMPAAAVSVGYAFRGP